MQTIDGIHDLLIRKADAGRYAIEVRFGDWVQVGTLAPDQPEAAFRFVIAIAERVYGTRAGTGWPRCSAHAIRAIHAAMREVAGC